MTSKTYSLAVSGAGISGLIAGIKAQQLGLSTVIIEKQKRFAEVLRGEYFQPAGLKTLDEVGLRQSVEELGLPVHSVEYRFKPLTPFTKHKTLTFPYGEAEKTHALAVPHLALKNRLAKKYADLGGVLLMDAVIDHVSIAVDNEITLAVKVCGETKKIHARHLGISEGVHSTLARKLPFRWRGENDGASFMVGGITRGDKIPEGRFVTSESREGLFCAFRLSVEKSRIYFYNDKPAALGPFKKKRPDDYLKTSLKTTPLAGLFKNAVLEDKVMAAPYVPCYALDPSRGSVTLLGDAAGASHPLGGMGMSTAAADGVRLARLLHENVSERMTLVELNGSYNKARLEKYLNGKFVSEFLSSIIGGTSPRERLGRRVALRLWSESLEARQYCGRLFGGLDERPLDLTGLCKIWGVQNKLDFLPGRALNVPRQYYDSLAFSPSKFFSEIIK